MSLNLSPPAFCTPIITRWRLLPGNLRGGIWMMLGGLEMSGAMAIAKALSPGLHAFELNFFRCIFGLVAMAPFIMGGGLAVLKTRNIHLHLGRGLFGGVGQVCVYFGLVHLSLAVVTAITFTRPLFLVVLAVLFLGERVRWRRWSAIAFGFIGVLIVARPVVETVTLPLLVLVFSTACHASAHVFLKKVSGRDNPMTVVFYYLLISTIVGAVPTYSVWVTPNTEQFLWLALTGILYLIGQATIAMAFRVAEATAIMPFDYSRLLYGILFDFLLFTHLPDSWTIAGSSVIIGATLYVARRQSRGQQHPTAAT